MKTPITKIVGVIPARYKSSRFEGKPLADILITFNKYFGNKFSNNTYFSPEKLVCNRTVE